MRRQEDTHRNRAVSRSAGFSLLELMLSCAVLLAIMGPLFYSINQMQTQSRTEERKLDMVEESREFMDQIIRDLHQAGTPSFGQFNYKTMLKKCRGTFWANSYVDPDPDTPVAGNCPTAAVGLVRFTNSDLWFEADVDGDGSVNVVRYTLYGQNDQPVENGGTCPCSLKRSQGRKVGDSATGSIAFDDEGSQLGATNYSVELQNVANTDIFQGLQATGGPAVGIPTANGYTDAITSLNSIKTVRVKINVAPTLSSDNKFIPMVSLTADAKVGNN